MRVLIAPQEFKGSLSADEAAAAIAKGIRQARPDWKLDVLPLSDGGPGFIDALRRAIEADSAALAVHDPIGRTVLGRYLVIRGSREAVVEAAQANGLFHLAEGERDPLHADTFGVGELIAAALEGHPPRLVVGVGGSATTDGGAGMARALGAHFLDTTGTELPPGGAPLARLARIEWQRPASLDGVDVVVATDVTNPLTGPNGAAAVYSPQKGASPSQVKRLDAALLHFADVVRNSLDVDISSMPGAGAAGGLAGGLVAFTGARIASGFEIVAEATDLAARLAAADIVVTGEGSFDSQSLQGKTTGRVIAMARAAGKPWVVFAGRAVDPADPCVLTLASLEPDHEASICNATELLRELARRWAETLD